VRIIIIGAGVSGLTAANIVTEHGSEVSVLEGRDRIGGRTWTTDLENGHADVGGAWIHGVEGNPLVPILTALGNPPHASTDRDRSISVLREDGIRWTPHEIQRLDVLWDTYDGTALCEHLGRDVSVADAVEAWIALENMDDTDAEIARYVVNVQEAGLNVAAPADRVSVTGAADFDYLDGRDDIPVGGYRTLVDGLATGLNIRTNTIIDTIEHSDHGVRVQAGEDSWDGDRLVVSVALGVLKASTIRFDPTLPIDKTDAIDRLAMGDLRKLIVEFDKGYWPDNGVWLYQSTDEAFPFSFDFTPFNGAPIIEMEFGGTFGASVDPEDDATLLSRGLDVLSRMLDVELPAPVSYVRSSWTSDPFSMGSYSYVPVEGTPELHDALSRPVGRLHFAGEAITRRFFGTVHGAYLSGRRAACDILGTDDVQRTFALTPSA
jgi:monoamine oxidase